MEQFERRSLSMYQQRLKDLLRGRSDDNIMGSPESSATTNNVVLHFNDRIKMDMNSREPTANYYRVVSDIAEKYTGRSQFDQNFMDQLKNSGARFYSSIEHNLREIGSGTTNTLQFDVSYYLGDDNRPVGGIKNINNRDDSDER